MFLRKQTEKDYRGQTRGEAKYLRKCENNLNLKKSFYTHIFELLNFENVKKITFFLNFLDF